MVENEDKALVTCKGASMCSSLFTVCDDTLHKNKPRCVFLLFLDRFFEGMIIREVGDVRAKEVAESDIHVLPGDLNNVFVVLCREHIGMTKMLEEQ